MANVVHNSHQSWRNGGALCAARPGGDAAGLSLREMVFHTLCQCVYRGLAMCVSQMHHHKEIIPLSGSQEKSGATPRRAAMQRVVWEALLHAPHPATLPRPTPLALPAFRVRTTHGGGLVVEGVRVKGSFCQMYDLVKGATCAWQSATSWDSASGPARL